MVTMNLQDKYIKEIRPQLLKELKLSNELAVPYISKIVVNIGLGEALTNKKAVDIVSKHIATITGQKPLVTKARRAISTFKLRVGKPIGVKVTLRRKRMYNFFDKVVTVVLPRLRDFRGIDEKKFDKQGNLSIGFPEYTVFPEMDTEEIDKTRGLEMTIVTSTKNSKEAKLLLEKLGMPFKNKAR
jgi:large subunit ribosomal protein L5